MKSKKEIHSFLIFFLVFGSLYLPIEAKANLSSFTRPSESTLVASPFGPRLKYAENDRFDWHRGIDIAGTLGENVYAMAEGTVDGAFNEGSPEFPGGGNVVRIKHVGENKIYYSLYFHLDSLAVKKGDVLNPGDKVGTMGQSGEAESVHLHFEIREEVSCSLEAQNKGACSATANGKDPHKNPVSYLYPKNDQPPTLEVLSEAPLTVRVTVPVTELDFNRLKVTDSQGKIHILDLNERLGFDPSTTQTLDAQTTAQNVTLKPDSFSSQSYGEGKAYGMEFVFNELTAYQSIEAEDVWGNGTKLSYEVILNPDSSPDTNPLPPAPEPVTDPVIPSPSPVFNDIAGTPYQSYIESLYPQVLKGNPDGSYKPYALINRAEFTAITIRALLNGEENVPEGFGLKCFEDVLGGEWFTEGVCYAKAKMIVSGYGEGWFRPEKTINAAEAFKIIAETFDLSQKPLQAGQQWYEAYAQAMSDAGAIPPTLISPSQLVNRQEMAAMMYSVIRNEPLPGATKFNYF